MDRYLSRKKGDPINGLVTGKNIFPRTPIPSGYLRLSVTSACNFDCFYCHREGDDCDTKNSLNYNEMLDIIRTARDFGIFRLTLTGGEPLLHPKILKIIKKSKKSLGIEYVAMATNGSKLEEMAPALKKAGLDSLAISLDTLNPTKLTRISKVKPEMMGNIIRGIDKAIEEDITHITVNHVVTRSNISELFDIIKFARDRQIKVKLLETIVVSACQRISTGYFKIFG